MDERQNSHQHAGPLSLPLKPLRMCWKGLGAVGQKCSKMARRGGRQQRPTVASVTTQGYLGPAEPQEDSCPLLAVHLTKRTKPFQCSKTRLLVRSPPQLWTWRAQLGVLDTRHRFAGTDGYLAYSPKLRTLRTLQERLNTQMGSWGLFRHARPASATQAAQRGEFPCQLCRHRVGFPADCQDLVTTGSRQWGWLGSALRVKIYDFAVYVDPKQARDSRLKGQWQSRLPAAGSQQAFYDGLRASNDIEMSLMVRASRNLPLILLTKEYSHILKRRLKAVGGDPKDAALQQMLDSFKHDRIPKDLLDGGSVRKGTVMTFTKDQQGAVIARANDHELATVQSPKLAAAIFDIYLGEPCVSKESRLAAGEGVVNMMAGTQSSPSVRGLCNRNIQACNFTR